MSNCLANWRGLPRSSLLLLLLLLILPKIGLNPAIFLIPKLEQEQEQEENLRASRLRCSRNDDFS
jgi:hypothetical protein